MLNSIQFRTHYSHPKLKASPYPTNSSNIQNKQ